MNKRTNGFAVSGFVCSFFNPLLGFIFSIVGICSTSKHQDKGKGLAIAGLIISILNMIVVAIVTVILIVALVTVAANPGDILDNIPKTISTEIRADVIEGAAKNYYEGTVFEKLSSKDLKKYEKSGYVLDLDTLITKNAIDSETSKDVVKSCDKKKTKITIYPKSPYSKKNYRIEKSINC